MPCALTIGNFDGVHRGHQALLSHVREAAAQLSVPAVVMTFEPHPREFFANLRGQGSTAPARIVNLRDKLQALADQGIDRVIVEHFGARFASLSAEQFIEHILVQGCHVRWIMVGDDFRFGERRSGNFETLREAGLRHGFEVHAMPTVTEGTERISSSGVRAALAAADLERVKTLLGRPYAITGHVIHGRKLGRTIGFPTANLRISHRHAALNGIFVVRVHGLGDKALPGVASIGLRPTVDDSGRVLLEVHLFDFAQPIYGKLLRVEFLKKLRDEVKYGDLNALHAAIAEDARQARAYFDLPPAVTNYATTATDRIS